MASKQMSYCSLEEAWGEDYANLYKKDDNMLTSMPKKTEDQDDTILKDRSLTKISTPVNKNMTDKEMGDYYMNMKNELTNKNDGVLSKTLDCDKFLEHFLDCKNCKKKVNKILDINDSSNDKSIIENFITKNIDDNYLDIFILILTGIFIIFILDCFVRLGRNFKK